MVASSAFAQTIVVHPSTIPNVTLLGPQNLQYTDVVREIVGKVLPAGMDAWLPFGVVVQNNDPQSLVAMAVRWTVTKANGSSVQYTLDQRAFTPGPWQIGTGKGLVGLPNHTAFYGPPGKGYEEVFLRRSSNLPDFVTAKSLDVVLDGVVFASGKFRGPDTAKEFEKWQAYLSANVQVAAHVMAMKNGGSTTPDILAWLHSLSPQANSRDLNQQYSGHAASQLSRHYQRNGEAAFFELSRSQSQPLIQLSR